MGAGVAWRLGRALDGSPRPLTHDQWTDALLDGVPGVPGPVNFFDGAAARALHDPRHRLAQRRRRAPLPARGLGRARCGWASAGSRRAATDPVTRDPVDYLLVSAGAGYNTNRFKFDAAVQYRRGSFRDERRLSRCRRQLDGGRPRRHRPAATREWRIKVSAIYRLADTEALRGAIRRIFG